MSFSAIQASRLSGCTPRQLEYWTRAQVVEPEDAAEGQYSFRDLVALRVVRSLLDAGMPLVRIKRVVQVLRAAGEELAGLQLVTDGRRVWACHDDGQILEVLRHGQLVLFVAVDRFAAEVEAEVAEFSRDRDSFVSTLRDPDAMRMHPAGSGRAPAESEHARTPD